MDDGRSVDRWATERSRYLKRALELRGKQAKAIAYTEQGFSWSGVADRMDSTKGTVSSWIERAMVLYGLEIAETLSPDELEPPVDTPTYDRVGPEYLDSLQLEDRKLYAEYFDRHRDKLPAGWVAEMGEELRTRGLTSVEH